jgi:putative glutamine amidotransferase
MQRNKLIIILFFFAFLGYSFGNEKIRIAITKASGHPAYLNYGKWLKSADEDVEIVDLFTLSYSKSLQQMKTVDGLLLSGGPDVHPGRFGKENESSRCEIELNRDTLEFSVYDYALKNNIPILGICRGMQLINVAQNGSLIIDLPHDKGTDSLHQNKSPEDSYHDISIEQNTLFYSLTNITSGNVNSNHHQGVDKLGDNLRASSRTSDGLIESFEWKNKGNLPWMLAVQWHPERLENKSLSTPIALEFIAQIKKKIQGAR